MPLKFAYVCNLLDDLEHLESRQVPLPNKEKAKRHTDRIKTWFISHRRLIDAPDTNGIALLSCLLPERRKDRYYGMQEDKLATTIGRCLGLGSSRVARLTKWRDAREGFASLLCHVVQESDAGTQFRAVTVDEIDETLDELATLARFSGPEHRTLEKRSTKTRQEILRRVVAGLRATELKWLVRIVLKTFSPVLINDALVLSCFHPVLPSVLRIQNNLGFALRLLEDPAFGSDALQSSPDINSHLHETLKKLIRPQVGVKVGRPQYLKARGIRDCLRLVGNGKWDLEPKYDGEYCQIHIDLSKGDDCIKIFSKSNRDSTQDRAALHDCIRQTLRLGRTNCLFRTKCIVEGEMVVFDTRNDSILEYHKIRKYVSRAGSFLGRDPTSPKKLYENLGIMYYDVLMIDDNDLLFRPHHERRRLLKNLVEYDHSMGRRASWGTIQFATSGPQAREAEKDLMKAFARSITLRCEGLVLKPSDGSYLPTGFGPSNNYDGTLIKLKKDYIPGMGDSADFAIVGATFNASNAYGLSSDTPWTDFALACLQNKEDVKRFEAKPVFKHVATISRPCISVENIEQIGEIGRILCQRLNPSTPIPQYTLQTSSELNVPKDTFSHPIVVEVLGSAFEKVSTLGGYMLRHPRITKIHQDRGVEDVVSFCEIQTHARAATEVPADILEDEEKWLKQLWGSTKSKKQRDGQLTSQKSNATSTTSKHTTPRSALSEISPRIMQNGPSLGQQIMKNEMNKTIMQDVLSEQVTSSAWPRKPLSVSSASQRSLQTPSSHSGSRPSHDVAVGNSGPSALCRKRPILVRVDSIELQPGEKQSNAVESTTSRPDKISSAQPYNETSTTTLKQNVATLQTASSSRRYQASHEKAVDKDIGVLSDQTAARTSENNGAKDTAEARSSTRSFHHGPQSSRNVQSANGGVSEKPFGQLHVSSNPSTHELARTALPEATDNDTNSSKLSSRSDFDSDRPKSRKRKHLDFPIDLHRKRRALEKTHLVTEEEPHRPALGLELQRKDLEISGASAPMASSTASKASTSYAEGLEAGVILDRLENRIITSRGWPDEPMPTELAYDSPFSDHCFYLSPALRSARLIREVLLPDYINENLVTEDLRDWRREVDPDADPLGSYVPESQAYPNLQKTVLVDIAFPKEMENVIEDAASLRLMEGETVQV
ncbi:MAG: hypothetical protein M1828_005726 [Chrysothrix sp. TS-e1954]|nr:MAG: hypothetical protein M1828_005726 [Chrysothrix sp. TS-e1954]